MPCVTTRSRGNGRSASTSPGVTHNMDKHEIELLLARREDGSEYLVKWKGCSYRTVEWVKKLTLLDKFPSALQRIRHFDTKHPGSEVEFLTPRKKASTHIVSEQKTSFSEELIERDIIKAEWLQMESVVTFRQMKDGGREWLVKWGGLPLNQGTWEKEDLVPDHLIKDWRHFNDRGRKAHLKTVTTRRPTDVSEEWYSKNIDEVHDENSNGDSNVEDGHKLYYKPIGEQLFDFQVEGIQWLLYNWAQHRGSILADEMGLGKTVQSSVFISAIHELTGGVGPCLVVAPLSTLTHWKRELAKWAPALRTVVFHGAQEERPLIQDYMLNWVNLNDGRSIKEKNVVKGKIDYKPKFDVMVASYETVIQTPSAFNCYHWRLVVMDEGHRLKGVDSLAKQVLCNRTKMNVDHHLLLTGTPIQNNLQELWSVLNVVDHDTFNNWDTFAEEYGTTPSPGQQTTMMTDEGAKALVEIMKPYILRRHKTDVMKQVPPKEEVVVSVEFTRMQRKVYRSVYEKSFCQLAAAENGGGGCSSLIDTSKYRNICMQLRKCLAHPYLLDDVEEAHIQSNQSSNPDMTPKELEMKSLVEMSGKMVFLDKLLPRLMETQQKVLVFSQMTRALDVIEDYLLWKGYKYERLDGNVSGTQRQEAIDRFNDTSSQSSHGASNKEMPWIFLLSTRAGGVGINLTAANVVVIYDSDWNPQNDMQAQARCHRIGQKKEVKVYRLITRDSYEERMFDVASKKLGLEQALMSGVTKNSKLELSKKELQDLIRRGAYAAFEDDDANNSNQQSTSDGFLAASIDDILSSERTKTVRYGTVVAGGQKSAFSKATFVANVADLEKDDDEGVNRDMPSSQRVNVDDADFWQKLAGEDFDRLVSQGLVDPGSRRKNVVSYVQPSWADYKRMDGGPSAARVDKLTYAQQVAMDKIQKLGTPWTDKDTRHRLKDFLTSGAYGHWSAMRSYIIGSQEDMPPQRSPSEASSSSSSSDSEEDGRDTPKAPSSNEGDGGPMVVDEVLCEVLMLSFIGLLIKVIVLLAERNVNNEEEDDDSDYVPDGASTASSTRGENTLLDQLEWLLDIPLLKAVADTLNTTTTTSLTNTNERCWARLWERLKQDGRRATSGGVDTEYTVILNGIGTLLTSNVSPVVAYLFPQWSRLVDGSMKMEEKMDYIDQAAEEAQKMLNTMNAIHGLVTLVAPSLPSSIDTPFIVTSVARGHENDEEEEVATMRMCRVGTRVEAFHRVDEEWQSAVLKERHVDGTCEVEWLQRKDQYHRFISSALIRRSGDNEYDVNTSNEPKWMKRSALTVATTRIRQWWTCDDDRDLIEAMAAGSGLHTVLRKKATHRVIPYTSLKHRLEQLHVWYDEDFPPPSNDFIISRVKALWRGWKEAQDINIWTSSSADQDQSGSKDLLRAFVRLTLRHGVPPTLFDPVIRKIPGTKADLVPLISSGRSSPSSTMPMHPSPVVQHSKTAYAMPPSKAGMGSVPLSTTMSHGSLGLPLGTSTMMSTPQVVNLPPPWRSESIMPKDILSLREVNEWCSWVIDTVVPRTLQSYASPSGVLKLTKAYLEVLRCIARDEVCTLDEHPDDEPINTKTFEDAGLSFAASSKGSSSSHHRNRAKETARQYLRMLHLHHILRVLVFYQSSSMNWYPHLTSSLEELKLSTDWGEREIINYLLNLCKAADMDNSDNKFGEMTVTLGRIMTRGLRISRGFTEVEMRVIQEAFMPLKKAAAIAEARLKADAVRRKKVEAEPPVLEKWGKYGRTEAMVKIIRKLGVPQQLWSTFLDLLGEYRPVYSNSRTKVGFRKPLNDKISSPLGGDLVEDDQGKFDAISAWDYIFSSSQGIKNDKALQARFVGCTKLKSWSKAAMEELGSISRKSPSLKAQDCIDFACVYLWELARGLRMDSERAEDTPKNPFHDVMFIPFTSVDIGLDGKETLPLIGKDGYTSLIEEFEEMQVKASLQSVFGKFPNPPAQSTLTLEDVFKKKLDELIERINNFTIIDSNTHEPITITWWNRETHDRALLACVMVHGMPSGWDDEEVLGSDQLPFFYWARQFMLATQEDGNNRKSRRKCNDGSIKQEGSLAYKAYHYLMDVIKPGMRDRIMGIIAQVELAVKNKAAKAAAKTTNHHHHPHHHNTAQQQQQQPSMDLSRPAHGLSLVSMSSTIKGTFPPPTEPFPYSTTTTNPSSYSNPIPKRKRQDLVAESAANDERRASIQSPDLKRSRPAAALESRMEEVIEITDSC